MLPERSHAELQRDFHAALWRPEPPSGLTAPEREEVAQRFKVYRNNIQHSLTRALAARFPVIEQLVGTEFFAAMAGVFIAESPPADPVLLRWGETFATFLDQFPPVLYLPFLGDVARLEYLRGRACHAADAQSIAADALNVPDPESLRLDLHPSVGLFFARMPAVQIWQSHQPGATRKPLTQGPDHALIAREADFTVIVEPTDPDTFAVLSALRDGKTLGEAAGWGDPVTALMLLLRHGLITRTETGTPI
ncbi:MAG: DUF2063 domain-containing protein [Paracoccaceae bacterium]